VRIGRASYNAVEIVSGLAPGDRVILSDTTAYDQAERITIAN
jgi:HlyD family secretion protein